MVESTTQNYGWTKPEVTKSASTWGGFLNNDLDAIDAIVFANQQGVVPIGAIQMFGGATAPANWLLCNGASLVRVAPYDKLFAIIGTAFGAADGSHFSLPNLLQRYPLGVNPSNPIGMMGGNFSVTVAIGNMPSHTHTATEAAHTHVAVQASHSHPDFGHTHGVTDPGHFHTGTMRQTTGFFALAAANPQIQASQTDSAVTGISINTATANLGAAQPSITVAANTPPAITVSAAGSGAPFNVVPPFVAVNFIIRFT